MDSDKIFDVIILGGGVAGCKAVETLNSNGITNFLLLEAQNQLGGRLQTEYLNGDVKKPLEMGANWFHGTIGNPLFELVQQNPEHFVQTKDKLFKAKNIMCLDQTGNQYDLKIYDEVKTFFESLLFEIQENYKKQIDFGSVRFQDYIDEKFKNYTRHDDDETKRIKRAFLNTEIYMQCIQCGAGNINDVSLSQFGSYEEFDGGLMEFPGGYSKLIEFLVNKIPTEQIKLNHAVQQIDKSGENLTVTCQNGVDFKAKHVLVTCSLGYLKNNYATLFGDGLLYGKKQEAIQKLDMGQYFKAFFVFDDMSFFPNDIDVVSLLSFQHETVNQNDKWLSEILKFEKVYANVLRTRIIGSSAIHVQQLTDDEICLKIAGLLRKVFKNDQIQQPCQLIKSNWTNEYINGCYTYIPEGATVEHVKDLSEPIYFDNIPKILFAGEATHSKYYSCAIAAYLTGQHEANRLIGILNS